MEDHRFYKHKHVLTLFEKKKISSLLCYNIFCSAQLLLTRMSPVLNQWDLDSLIWTMFFFFASSQNHMIWNRIIEKNSLRDSILIRIYLETRKDIFAINMHSCFSFRLFMFSVINLQVAKLLPLKNVIIYIKFTDVH